MEPFALWVGSLVHLDFLIMKASLRVPLGGVPFQVLQEAYFGPWPLTQYGLPGGSLCLGGGPGSVPGPSP